MRMHGVNAVGVVSGMAAVDGVLVIGATVDEFTGYDEKQARNEQEESGYLPVRAHAEPDKSSQSLPAKAADRRMGHTPIG